MFQLFKARQPVFKAVQFNGNTDNMYEFIRSLQSATQQKYVFDVRYDGNKVSLQILRIYSIINNQEFGTGTTESSSFQMTEGTVQHQDWIMFDELGDSFKVIPSKEFNDFYEKSS